MATQLVDSAAELKEEQKRATALEGLALFAGSAEQLGAALAPDVEAGRVVYEGTLRYKRVEELYGAYLDTLTGAWRKLQEQQMAVMMGPLMGEGPGGAEAPSSAQVEQVQARVDECDKHRLALASVFKISENKAEKLLEQKMAKATEEAQKEMLQGLANMS